MRLAAPLVALLTGATLAACFEARDRPGPPRLAIVLDTIYVGSPDTLTGRVAATDPDGIDSLWLIVDSVRFGEDGFLESVIDLPFIALIPQNRPIGFQVTLRFEARDAVGFVASTDTFVTVTTAAGH